MEWWSIHPAIFATTWARQVGEQQTQQQADTGYGASLAPPAILLILLLGAEGLLQLAVFLSQALQLFALLIQPLLLLLALCRELGYLLALELELSRLLRVNIVQLMLELLFLRLQLDDLIPETGGTLQ